MTLSDLVNQGAERRLRRALQSPEKFGTEELVAALTAAARSGKVDMVAALLEAGADPNRIPEGRRWGPMHIAVEHVQVDALRELIAAGGDVDLADESGMTLLHLAVDIEADGAHQTGTVPRTDMTALLLEHGADPALRDGEGKTPADVARDYGHHEALPLLEKQQRREGG